MSIFYLNQPYYYYDSNPDYYHIPFDYSLISVEIDYQSTSEVTEQEIEKTSYKGTKIKEQTENKNHD